jgi:thiamine kinase-like enzyme
VNWARRCSGKAITTNALRQIAAHRVMKTEAPDIDHAQLIELLNAEYGLGMTSLRFVPKGEEAYAYIASTHNGEQYFVRAQPSSPAALAAWENVYTITHALHKEHRLFQVVAPRTTNADRYTVRFMEHVVAVFPFIDGTTLYQHGATDEDLRAAATLLAAVHRCGTVLASLGLPKETFGNPFEAPILAALDIAESPPPSATPHQRNVCHLLAAERADILGTLEHMQRLQAQAHALPLDWVLTHGDPNLDNLLKDQQGNVHLTDWGEVALGPPERDLSAFTGERFEVFLQRYAGLKPDLKLHANLFAFYFYRWTMQEIADYATRLLFRDLGPIEDAHAWAELQPYLPIRHDDIAEGLHNVQHTIERVLR